MKDDFNTAADDRVRRLFDRLSRAPEGEAVVAFLKAAGVRIELQENPYNWAASTLTITKIENGLYSYEKPVIILKESLSDDNLLQAIVHEAGHLNQHLSRTGNPDRILSEEQCILFYRVAEADAQALAAETAWALKQAGDPGPWEAAKFVGYGDICDAYEKAVTEDPSAVSGGRAKRAAFDAWFGNPERLAGYNQATVEGMIPFLEKGREIFKGHGLAEKPLDGGWLAKLDAAAIRPYLRLAGFRDILADPWYARDTHTRPAPKPDVAPNAANGNPPNPPALKAG